MVCPDAHARLSAKSRRYDDKFWKELFGKSGGDNHKRSKEQNLKKELGY
jgi:hypothetical protein